MEQAQIKPAFGEVVDEYLSDCRRRGYSELTVYSYHGALRRFFLWLEEQYPATEELSDITPEAITDYQMDLFGSEPQRKRRGRKENRLSTETQYHWLGTLLWFFRWLLSHEKILINPAAGIHLPKRPQRIPRSYLSLREMQKLLKAIDLSTHIGVRNRAIIEVLYSSGIRSAELQHLRIDDINFQDGWITVRQGKGKKDRVVPLGKAAAHFVSAYLEKTRTVLLKEKTHDFLFVTQYGVPISHDSLERLVGKAARAAGIKRPITPHSLRHTCATLMLRGRADIRHIQELLGHSSLSSTQIYTRVEIGDLKKVHHLCHPREREPIDEN
jgi:integrase/recombinase XerD